MKTDYPDTHMNKDKELHQAIRNQKHAQKLYANHIIKPLYEQ